MGDKLLMFLPLHPCVRAQVCTATPNRDTGYDFTRGEMKTLTELHCFPIFLYLGHDRLRGGAHIHQFRKPTVSRWRRMLEMEGNYSPMAFHRCRISRTESLSLPQSGSKEKWRAGEGMRHSRRAVKQNDITEDPASPPRI